MRSAAAELRLCLQFWRPAIVSNDYRRRGCNFCRPSMRLFFCVCVCPLLQKHGVRIIIGNFYEDKAAVIFCEAFKQKMYGAKYAWIITGIKTAINCCTKLTFSPPPKEGGYVLGLSVCLSVCLSARLLKKLYIQGGPKNGATLFRRNTAQICTIFFAEIKVV